MRKVTYLPSCIGISCLILSVIMPRAPDINSIVTSALIATRIALVPIAHGSTKKRP